MGFSAGGHICADLAGRFDTSVYTPIDAADAASAKPGLVAPIYPVVSMTPPIAHGGSRAHLLGENPTSAAEAAHSPAQHIRAETPPCFLVHAIDDPVVPVDNSLILLAALRKAGVPCEAHLFERGGHGFAMRNAVGLPAHVWPELFLTWAAPKLGL
jgi:acetyl esterase/lipase